MHTLWSLALTSWGKLRDRGWVWWDENITPPMLPRNNYGQFGKLSCQSRNGTGACCKIIAVFSDPVCRTLSWIELTWNVSVLSRNWPMLTRNNCGRLLRTFSSSVKITSPFAKWYRCVCEERTMHLRNWFVPTWKQPVNLWKLPVRSRNDIGAVRKMYSAFTLKNYTIVLTASAYALNS